MASQYFANGSNRLNTIGTLKQSGSGHVLYLESKKIVNRVQLDRILIDRFVFLFM